MENLADGDPNTDHGSAGKVRETFVDFDFGAPATLAGFRHQDRSDSTKGNSIGLSELVFFDDGGHGIGRRSVVHSGLGSCRNWFTIDRWADVSNRDFGVTWVSLDAPLVEVGGLTANLFRSQTVPDVWRKQVGNTQKLYAWVMNNQWGTNYRVYQDGPARFWLRPHSLYAGAASRLAIGASQPLLALRAELL